MQFKIIAFTTCPALTFSRGWHPIFCHLRRAKQAANGYIELTLNKFRCNTNGRFLGRLLFMAFKIDL
jgi:hypothetical protein